ncbi:MAG: hypothetical protein AAFN10_24900 [Bacteroidota bacterium]
MSKLSLLTLVLCIFSMVVDRDASEESMLKTIQVAGQTFRAAAPPSKEQATQSANLVRGALMTTRIQSLAELKSLVKFEYFHADTLAKVKLPREPMLRITHNSSGRSVSSILKKGVSEADFIAAKYGGLWEKIKLGLRYPYSALNRTHLMEVSILARRRPDLFQEGDPAFFDLAMAIEANISKEDVARLDPRDLSEKGFLNSFNHITAQAFLTSIYSEQFADFIADAHERYHMPELISGHFSPKQREDIENGAVDNYVDIINNEWGQELGKALAQKHQIDNKTLWTPGLLAAYLNDMQTYFSWAFGVNFEPFAETDQMLIRFSHKLNRVQANVFSLSLN